jgi:hypothetical protein
VSKPCLPGPQASGPQASPPASRREQTRRLRSQVYQDRRRPRLPHAESRRDVCAPRSVRTAGVGTAGVPACLSQGADETSALPGLPGPQASRLPHEESRRDVCAPKSVRTAGVGTAGVPACLRRKQTRRLRSQVCQDRRRPRLHPRRKQTRRLRSQVRQDRRRRDRRRPRLPPEESRRDVCAPRSIRTAGVPACTRIQSHLVTRSPAIPCQYLWTCCQSG